LIIPPILDFLITLLQQQVTDVSGPIVRTGTTPKYWENWDRIFGDDAEAGGSSKSSKKPAKSGSAKKKQKKASAARSKKA
jgi:hypothetical protein